MVKKGRHRYGNFKRSFSKDRSFLDWCGSRTEPSVTNGMAHISALLPDLVEEIGLRDGITLEVLNTAWEDIVGSNIANNSNPLDIRDGVLRVRVSQSVLKHHLQQNRGMFLARVQEALPEAKIKDITILL